MTRLGNRATGQPEHDPHENALPSLGHAIDLAGRRGEAHGVAVAMEWLHRTVQGTPRQREATARRLLIGCFVDNDEAVLAELPSPSEAARSFDQDELFRHCDWSEPAGGEAQRRWEWGAEGLKATFATAVRDGIHHQVSRFCSWTLAEAAAANRGRLPETQHDDRGAATARHRAARIGRQNGSDIAEWWQQEHLGGRANGDVTVTARRVLQGIHDGDPEILDSLPTWDDTEDHYELDDLLVDCVWEEPDIADVEAHSRWGARISVIWNEYTTALHQTVEHEITRHCRNALDHDSPPPPRSVAEAPLDRLAHPHGSGPAGGLGL